MKKISIFLVSCLLLMACQQASVYQKYGKQLTRYNTGNVIESTKDSFVYELSSTNILLTVKLVSNQFLLIMNIQDENINMSVTYDMCHETYDFSKMDVKGNDDVEALKQLFMNEFNRLLSTDLSSFKEVSLKYCKVVKK